MPPRQSGGLTQKPSSCFKGGESVSTASTLDREARQVALPRAGLQRWPQHLARHHNDAEYRIIELSTQVVKTDDLVDLDKKIAAVRAKKAAKESEENEKAAKESEESEESEPRDRKKVR